MDTENILHRFDDNNLSDASRLILLGYLYYEVKENLELSFDKGTESISTVLLDKLPSSQAKLLRTLESFWQIDKGLTENLEAFIEQCDDQSLNENLLLLGCAIFIDEPVLFKDILGYTDEDPQVNFKYYNDLKQAIPGYYPGNEESVQDKIDIINGYINKNKIYCFQQESLSFIDSIPVLTLKASLDFSYYHTLEIIFKNITFLQCPISWERVWGEDSFHLRQATKEEKERVIMQNALSQVGAQLVFCLDTKLNNNSSTQAHYFIVASNIEYNFDTVYYYKKEDLGVNERTASWVK